MHIQITWIRFNWYSGGGDFQCLNFSLFGLKQCCCMSSTGLKYSALVVGYSYEQVKHCTRVMYFKLFLKFYNWRFTAFFCTCKLFAYNSQTVTPPENKHAAWKMNGLHTNYSTYPNQMPHTEICSPSSAPCHYILHKQKHRDNASDKQNSQM